MTEAPEEFFDWSPSKGADKLETYLAKKSQSRRSFALKIGIWPERLHRFLKGTSRPTLAEACKMAKAVRGMKPEDWLPEEKKDGQEPKPTN